MDQKQIIIERVFDTPREKVWEAWTNPELIKKWWGPEGFYAPSIQVDFRVGGKTKLSIMYTAESEEIYQAMLKSGMKEGWSTSLDKIERMMEE